jgi:predicted TIM-barrel fold metal-dependent hydrolase
MFLESDTTVAVLSGLPAATEPGNPVTNDEIAQSRDIINMLADGSQRLVNHHMVLPNKTGTTPSDVQAQLDEMQRVKEAFGTIGAWKCYPAWSPNNTETAAFDGWFLDDPATGVPFVEKGIELGIPLFCIHKGLPIPGFSTAHNNPVDIGRVAQRYPQATFVVYHSGFGNDNDYFEKPYTMGSTAGTNALVTSLLNAGIGPGSNVYAELGTTWQLVSTNPIFGPDAAAHVIGKLLKYVGEDNVVWGTDSIWYGSPQSQIESFLQFQISEGFRAQHGYPELTLEIKRKILGLNAARIYGIDPAAVRCGILASELASAKRQLDHDLGARRWALGKPMLTRRRDFWRLLRRGDLRPG